MTPAQALSIDAIWQQWERRIVNARYPLLQYLGGSKRSAFYLTEIGGAKAAIKLIPAGTPRAAAQIACWRLSGGLSHLNLVKIVEIGLWHADQEQDMRFAVMEYCDESLADLLRQRLLTPAEAREVLAPTLDALRYLHGQGLLHGQIKPAHLLANGDQLKLSSDTIHRNGEGHPSAIESPYDAPEKTAGTISLSGDVWSLGITLFEALTGHLPGAGDAKSAEKLPSPFNAIVAGCLERERERRLSLSAIRAILDKPVAQPSAASQQTAKSSSNVIVLPADKTRSEATPPSPSELSKPASSLEKFAAAEKVSPPAPSTPYKTTVPQSDGRDSTRKVLLLVGVVAALLAVVLVLRLTRKTPNATAPTKIAVARPSAEKITQPAKAVDTQTATATNPVACFTGRMPVVSGHARNRLRHSEGQSGSDSRCERPGFDAKLATRGPSTYFANAGSARSRQWTFAPPVRDGKPQSSEWAVQFRVSQERN